MPARAVDLPSVQTEEVKDGENVVVASHNYGPFRALIRDYDTALSIELKTDALISERKMDPNQVSDNVRLQFMLLATFSITCEQHPPEFSIKTLMQGDSTGAISFLLAYEKALREAETRFRQGPATLPAPGALGNPLPGLPL